MIDGLKNVIFRDCLPDSTPEDKSAEQSNLVDQKVRSERRHGSTRALTWIHCFFLSDGVLHSASPQLIFTVPDTPRSVAYPDLYRYVFGLLDPDPLV
jgi:hypothetical protein